MKGAEVKGEAEVARAFEHIADEVVRPTSVAQQLADIGVEAARSKAPTRTGELLGSIHAEVGVADAEVGTDIGYAPFQEFGTVYVPAVRFIGYGYGAMAERAEAIATDYLDGVLADADRMA